MAFLNRILEPELMIDSEQCKEFSRNHPKLRHTKIIRWIKSKVNLQGTLLNLGCGPARLDIMLCEEFLDLSILGIDDSPAMLQIADKNIAGNGLHHRIKLEQSDIKFVNGKFDNIISSDTLHHIHNPLIFWNAIKTVSKKGTSVFVVDSLRPDNMDQVNRILKILAKTNDKLYIDDFRNSLCASFSLEEIQYQLRATDLNYLKIDVTGDVCKTVYVYGIINH